MACRWEGPGAETEVGLKEARVAAGWQRERSSGEGRGEGRPEWADWRMVSGCLGLSCVQGAQRHMAP